MQVFATINGSVHACVATGQAAGFAPSGECDSLMAGQVLRPAVPGKYVLTAGPFTKAGSYVFCLKPDAVKGTWYEQASPNTTLTIIGMSLPA
jgi:hypothetical protein